jgi:hypothetical protein
LLVFTEMSMSLSPANIWFYIGVLWFPPPNKTDRPRYKWNIVESGIKHHNPKHLTLILNFRYNLLMLLIRFIQKNEWFGLISFIVFNATFSNISAMDLVCYTYFHWFFNPECQHIFGKQTGYIFQSPKTIKTWTTKHYASLNQWYNTE